jgi:hypothetical protein|tara:strand:- start:734 stop:1027 length:294 start_codon:yes stop_codon:yes gene_type:complete
MSKLILNKINKLQDQIEQDVYGWTWYLITDHFKVEEITDLTKIQIDEVVEICDQFTIDLFETENRQPSEAETLIAYSLRSVVREWGYDNDDDELQDY